MSNGDRWRLPDGREALEIDHQGSRIKVAPMRQDWPFPGIPEWVERRLCKKQPSRYLGEQLEDALW